ncbi:MAG TPA: MlaD family protein [Thermoleophilaceae bacterium]|nr:MlaD family protein [Thermoleophilaceae bacterium]
MRSRSGAASLVASPVLVGAVTTLVTIIAVFISYNANKGLPFVPTYQIKAELPSGGKLVKGNEVRTGGFRVGVVDDIQPRTTTVNGERKTIALVDLKLDKTVEPLGVDTKVRTRPRSALGLKYIELTPGKAEQTLSPGDTLPLRNASEPLDFEDIYSTFDDQTRPAVQDATEGFGNAFAGRGNALNTAIEALNPFMTHLEPVMRNLADPDTELDQFFLQIGRASAQAAPVAEEQARLFTHMADTFDAISRNPAALQQTIEKSPPTELTAIQSFRVQRPFLADFADLSRRLRPAARELPRSLPAINRAFAVGTPVLPRTVGMNEDFEGAFEQLDELFRNPNTLLTLRDIRTALTVTRPAIEYIAPYQTVCNYAIYFIHVLGEHQSQVAPDGSGTVQTGGVKLPNNEQPNSYGTSESSRNVDVPPDQKARGARSNGEYGPPGEPLHRLIAPLYSPAIDAQGNADCQRGQEGYPNGPFVTDGRYGPGELGPPVHSIPSGGNAPVVNADYPIVSGGTFKSRELGIDNLADVP